MSDDFPLFIVLCVAAFGAMLLANIGCASLASSERAIHAAEDVGVRNARVVSKGPAFGVFRGCSEHDVAVFKVRGTNRTVKVCAGVPFGGYTVRG